jgi:hypothetical protein
MNECPSAPNDSLLLDLLKIDSAKTVTCSNSVHPYLKFQNYGTNTIHNAVISASMDYQAADMLTWSGNLKTYDVIQIDGKHFTQVSDGSHTIKYYLSELNGSSTGFIRDTISMRYTCVQNNIQLPYFQDFSDPGFPYDKWTINNPYETIPTWERAELGYSHALRIPYYNIPSEYKSALYLPALSFLGNEKPCLRFDLACSHNNSTIHQAGYDLIVFSYSLDCGITWNLLTQLSSLDHQTAPDDSTYFVPTETQWKSMSIDLTKIANKESVIIMLASDPADGNNMYLRNIKFDNTATVNEKNSHEMVQVYPIPAKDILCIKFTRAMNGTRFDLYNCIGSKVASTNHPGGKEASLMLPDLLPGCYFLQVVTQEFTVTRKIMIE